MNTTSRIFTYALAACAAGLSAMAAAQQPVGEATAQSLLDALDSRPLSRSFVRTELPDATTNVCAAKIPSTSDRGTANSRTLEVVPYAGDSTAGVNLEVQFMLGSDKLSARDQKLLDNLATALTDPRLKGQSFTLAGHTDTTGTAKTNLELSCARALAVRTYLLKKGISAQRVSAYGFGSSRPLAAAPPEAPQHRRVEVRMAP